MIQRRNLAAMAAIIGLAVAPALAADNERSQHHPADSAAGRQMPGGAMAGMSGGMPMMGMMGPGGGMMMRMMQGHVEGRLAFLKTELKITDAQLPLWNAVAEAIRANAKSGMGMMEEMAGGMMGQGANLPDRFAAREKMMAARLDALRRLKSAVDPLYAALSDDQKKTADELLMSPMGMM
jgi:LTXXQ motif family protein